MENDGQGRYPDKVFHVTSYTYSPSPTMLAYEEVFRSSRPKQWPGGGDGRGAYCQGGNCSAPPSYSVDGKKPAVLCGIHREDGMHRVLHDDRNCGYKGCRRTALVRYMSEDGKINRFCHKHKKPDIVVTRTRHCEYGRCNNTPRYGLREGPQSFCREHKRAGMFTSRNGELLVATRDGSAFKAETLATPRVARNSAADASGSADIALHSPRRSAASEPAAAASGPLQDLKVSPYSPVLSRKLCEVPGCRVQPSYGEAGTSRPRFCSGHKKKGMVGLKNRPCLFPGCDTRPHYGLKGGRPQYCATHKSDEMIHLLKESLGRERLRTPRKLGGCETVMATDTKDRPAAAGSKGNKPKASNLQDTSGEKDAGGAEQGEEPREAKGQGRGKTSQRNVVASARGNPGRNGKGSVLPQPRPASPLPATEVAPFATVLGAEITPAAQTVTEGKQSPPTSRVEEEPEMPPSVEMRLLGEAKESAKALVAANGSGRRARAPSRKLLEALGKMNREGAQLMTREKREEQDKQQREKKEKRRAAAAAGVKAGHVIEAFAVPVAGGGVGYGSRGVGRNSRGGTGDGGGIVEGNNGGAGDGGGGVVSDRRGVGTNPGEPVSSNPTICFQAEILPAAARQLTVVGGTNLTTRGSSAITYGSSTTTNDSIATPHGNSATTEVKAAIAGGNKKVEGAKPAVHDRSASAETKTGITVNDERVEGANRTTYDSSTTTHDNRAATHDSSATTYDSSATTYDSSATPHDSNATIEAKSGATGSKKRVRGDKGKFKSVAVEAGKAAARKRKLAELEAERELATGVSGVNERKRIRKPRAKETVDYDSNDYTEEGPSKEVKRRSCRRGQEGADGGTTAGQVAADVQVPERLKGGH